MNNYQYFRTTDWSRKDLDFARARFATYNLISNGKIIITDRLQGFIWAYLHYQPVIYIDDAKFTIQDSMNTAFKKNYDCHDVQKLRYAEATNITHALQLANFYLENNRFE